MTQSGEVRVCGVHAGGFYIEDLRLLVPQNVATTIAAADAFRSKDLWRGLGMKSLQRMGLLGETVQAAATPPPVTAPAGDAQLMVLEEQNRLLWEMLASKSESEAAREAEHQRLLQAVEGLSHTVQVAPVVNAHNEALKAPQQASGEHVSGDVPMFVPSKVSEVPAGARVSVASTESNGDVHQTRNALRKLRGGVQ
jgi:hypothetical protein